jgi:hypothetical protein
MNVCPECRALDKAHAAAFERFTAAGRLPRLPHMATPEQVIEVRESKKAFDEIKAKRTAHIKQCAHPD